MNILQGTGTTPASSTKTASSSAASSSSTGTGASGLNTAAKAAGKLYYGTASDLPSNTAYIADLSNAADFGQLTPANQMKWVRLLDFVTELHAPNHSHANQANTEPTQGTFTFAGGDALVALAKKNGQLVRGEELRPTYQDPDI